MSTSAILPFHQHQISATETSRFHPRNSPVVVIGLLSIMVSRTKLLPRPASNAKSWSRGDAGTANSHRFAWDRPPILGPTASEKTKSSAVLKCPPAQSLHDLNDEVIVVNCSLRCFCLVHAIYIRVLGPLDLGILPVVFHEKLFETRTGVLEATGTALAALFLICSPQFIDH